MSGSIEGVRRKPRPLNRRTCRCLVESCNDCYYPGWWVRFTDAEGKPRQKKGGPTKMSAAKARELILAAVAIEKAGGQLRGPYPEKATKSIKLHAWAEEYRRDYVPADKRS